MSACSWSFVLGNTTLGIKPVFLVFPFLLSTQNMFTHQLLVVINTRKMAKFKHFCVAISLAFLYLVNCQDSEFEFEDGGECKVTEKSSEEIKPCIFPFIYENNSYYGCTLDGPGEITVPWCSTKVDPLTLVHIPNEGVWGDCNDSCPSDAEGLADFEFFKEQSNCKFNS